MLSLFKKKDAGFVGVDIGSSSVKLVALETEGGQPLIKGYAVVSMPSVAVMDGHIQEVNLVSDAIERAAKIAGVKDEAPTVVAVPSSSVITKRISLSASLSEMELEEQVKLEADQFIPYPIDDVGIDFQVMGSQAGNEEFNDVLVVACRRQDVEIREDAVNGAGLVCEVVDVDTYACERAFTPLKKSALAQDLDVEGLVGIADIGASTLTLNVFKDGDIIYSREQSFGGDELSNSLHHLMGISVEEVEQKFRLNEFDADVHQSHILPFRNTVAQQVSRALQFFYSSGNHVALKALFLSGGTSMIGGLAEQIEHVVGVPTRVANPFVSIKVASRVNRESLSSDAPVLFKALGLALRAKEAS